MILVVTCLEQRQCKANIKALLAQQMHIADCYDRPLCCAQILAICTSPQNLIALPLYAWSKLSKAGHSGTMHMCTVCTDVLNFWILVLMPLAPESGGWEWPLCTSCYSTCTHNRSCRCRSFFKTSCCPKSIHRGASSK